MNAVGIDVSKGKSTVAVMRPFGEVVLSPFEVSHTGKDLSALAEKLKSLPGETRVVMEHTGYYHAPVALALHESGIYVSAVNAMLVHDYGNNSLRRAKTDRKDAVKLANYALDQWLSLPQYHPEEDTRQMLKTCYRQYEQFSKIANTETKRKGYSTIKQYVSYSCSTYQRSGRCICSWHRIYEKMLTQIVTSEIAVFASAVDVNESSVIKTLSRRLMRDSEQRLAGTKQEITTLRRHIRELEDKTAKLYEDKVGGVISEDTFTILAQKNEQERIEKAERLDTLLSEMQKVEADTAAITDWTALIRKYTDIQTLDRDTIDALIDHIEIGERTVIDGKRQQDIKIYYRFVGFLADTLP